MNRKINTMIYCIAITFILVLIASVILVIALVNDLNEPKYRETYTTAVKKSTKNDTISKCSIEKENEDSIFTALYTPVKEWQVWCGDFEEEQMEYLIETCNTYNVDPKFMLSIICVESSFRSDCTTSKSSASGYCQVVKGTAEWVYESLLKRGEYDIDNHVEINTTDWRLNIELGVKLVSWLHNYYGTYEMVAKRYYGSTNESENEIYLNKIDSRMVELFDTHVSDINK